MATALPEHFLGSIGDVHVLGVNASFVATRNALKQSENIKVAASAVTDTDSGHKYAPASIDKSVIAAKDAGIVGWNSRLI